jgi:hypothetical protein
MPQVIKLELLADYFQFYLQDENAKGDLSDSWGSEAVDRLLAVAQGTVGIGTVRNMTVPVVVEILDAEPKGDADAWDHVTECSLDVPTGRVVIAGCTDYFPKAARIEVTPGLYRVRVSYGGLDTISMDCLSGEDHYRIQLWRGPRIDPRILKKRTA